MSLPSKFRARTRRDVFFNLARMNKSRSIVLNDAEWGYITQHLRSSWRNQALCRIGQPESCLLGNSNDTLLNDVGAGVTLVASSRTRVVDNQPIKPVNQQNSRHKVGRRDHRRRVYGCICSEDVSASDYLCRRINLRRGPHSPIWMVNRAHDRCLIYARSCPALLVVVR